MICLLKRLSFLLLFPWTLTPAFSQLSPGELSQAHHQLEGVANCTRCHEIGKEISREKCLNCHRALQARVVAGQGYHSSPDVQGKSCAQCHSEHNGTGFELIHWQDGERNFSHALTGYTLVGAHQKLECRACHIPHLIVNDLVRPENSTNSNRTFLGLGVACNQCHADEHRSQLGTFCDQCHTPNSWTPAVRFSHEKTAYPLTGKHLVVSCSKCHSSQESNPEETSLIQKKNSSHVYTLYKGIAFSNCFPCHKDSHEGKFGGDCSRCHNTADFRQVSLAKFDHGKTHYPLEGRHLQVRCEKCHPSGRMTDPVSHERCLSCHHDEHQGQFASRPDRGDCASCHEVAGFKPARYDLEQHENSRFPLKGAHLAVACNRCHERKQGEGKLNIQKFQFDDRSCRICHRDVHKGQADKWMQQTGCDFCHTTDSWHQSTFNHDSTTFPLVGKHQKVTCGKCHQKDQAGTVDEVVQLRITGTECTPCHQDKHRGQFDKEKSADCKHCHTAEGWTVLNFNHDLDSRFKLEGAHAKVPCRDCHKPLLQSDGSTVILYRSLPMDCTSCHAVKAPASGRKG